MEVKEKVLVLLATYNGEKYLKEQLDSILNQEQVEVKILVRDDGSTDGTCSILEKYKGEKLDFYIGDNVGPAKAFLSLINDSYKEYSFYAYADQDDVWNSEKLIKCINKIKGNKSNKPALCMSTYDVVDENLNYVYTRNMEFEREINLFETIMYRSPSGCTMVFDKKLRDIMLDKQPKSIRMHDFWTLLTAQVHKADILTIDESLMKYRIHGENTVGLSPKFLKRIKRLFRSMIYNCNERQKQAISLLEVYEEEIDEEIKDILLEIKDYNKSLKSKWRFLSDKRFRSNSLYINLLFKISVVFGVF